jgi:serine/threonine protein kinase/tetratricopeptide (TPR) repeat protein
MSFGPDDWPRIKDLFNRARVQPPDVRAKFLDEACAGHEALRREIESLLGSYDRSDSFLETSPAHVFGLSGVALLTGRRIGPYQLSVRIGAGGMGEVYKARDTRLDRTVAIKVLPSAVAPDAQAHERFEREARAVAALNHPHICTLHDIGSQDGIDYLVMEFLEGETLATRLQTGALDVARAVEYGTQIASALEAAHHAGLVHRDLKPGNIMLVKSGAKLLDFGLAKTWEPLAAGGQTIRPTEGGLTTPGVIIGTLEYMAPEQIEGMPVDSRTDIFAFGLVLFEMLTGRKAFPGTSQAGIMAAILKDEPTEIHGQPELNRIVRRCLAKDRAQRFQDAHELGAALAGVRAGTIAGIASAVTDSLAVLPLANVAGDEDTEYLCEGIVETLINHLSRVSTLRVVARTTAFQYRHERDTQKTARELGVRTLLTGRLVRRGDTLNIQVELIDPYAGTQLWGQKYNRRLTDIFVVEEDVAQEIIRALRLHLVPGTAERLARRQSDNVEAYQLCLKGRFFWNKRTRDALERAIECYRQAIEVEPSYAMAYAGLADCYNVLGTFSMMPPLEAFPRARAAARRALEIDDSLVTARIAEAVVSSTYDRDYDRGERAFLQAIETDPRYPEARQWYGIHLCVRGRFDEGIPQLRCAQQLDALSPMVNTQLASGYYLARQYAQAKDVLRATLDIHGSFGPAHWFLGKVYAHERADDHAIAELQKAVDATGRAPVFLGTLGWALGFAGRTTDAERVLDELRARSAQEYVSPMCFAYVHAGRGEPLIAVEKLREALAERAAFATWIKVEPMFDSLRGDPGFDALLDSLG